MLMKSMTHLYIRFHNPHNICTCIPYLEYWIHIYVFRCEGTQILDSHPRDRTKYTQLIQALRQPLAVRQGFMFIRRRKSFRAPNSKDTQAFTMTKHSFIRSVENVILTTDGTIGCVMSDTWCQTVWPSCCVGHVQWANCDVEGSIWVGGLGCWTRPHLIYGPAGTFKSSCWVMDHWPLHI